jgi:hypothetical protein
MIMRVLANIFNLSRKLKSFEDLPPSDDEPNLSDESVRPLGKRTRARYPQVPGCPSDVDSMTQVDFRDEDQISDGDYGDTFQPRNEDGYNDEGTNLQMRSPVTQSETPSVDATILAGIQILREVRMATNQWVSSLGPLESWPRVFQEHYDAACQGNAGHSTQEEVDEFLESVERHMNTGRLILKKLRESPIVSPPPSHEAWGDFLGAGDLMETLYRGIAILEVRLDIFAPCGPSPLEGESSIRKWRGLVDQF